MAEHEGGDGQRQHHVIEHGRAAAQVPEIVAAVVGDRKKEAARPAEPAKMVEADARELGKGDGEDSEIDAAHAEAEGEKADDRAAQHRDRDRGAKTDPRPDAEMDVERGRGIAAEPDIDRVAERELAGKAHHHVPGLAGIGEVENDDQDRQQIVVSEPGRDEQCGQQHRQQCEASARHPFDEPGDHESRFPRRPCGRNKSTSTSSPKENMLLADGVKRRPAIASVSPINIPPSSAPGMEPRPPVMTMMKASSV